VVSTKPLLGTIIFLLAILTDTFDGYIARKSKQVTKLGMLLDPLADKLLVISALIVLVDMGFIEAWIAIVIIAREFIVTGLRIVALSKDILIPAETGGKIKTTAQFISIVILLIDRSIVSLDLYTMGIALLWFAMLVGIISGIQYFVLFWKRLT
jgi:CDP-diacylglycerol--glycerol-3-phosphate 3-phosphatidyltransferase